MSKYSEKLALRREVLEDCPVLGRIGVREITALEFLELSDKQAGKNIVEQMQLAAVACLEDPDTHEPALTEDDIPKLVHWDMLQMVNDACNRCCGTPRSAEDARKN